MAHDLRYLANCSILFPDVPLLQRPAAARAAGFDAVEFWWPFPSATPSDAEVDRFVAAVRDAGVQLVGLNFAAGDMPAGDRGLVSWPGRESEFLDSVEVAVGIAGQLGTATFNALYGNRLDGHSAPEQDELAVSSLAAAATAAARVGATVLLEPVSGAPRYPLRTAQDVVDVLTRVQRETGRTELRLLADLYHLSVNGDDVPAALAQHSALVGHVQIADAPGRHEPGTGELPLDDHLSQLAEAGYRGWVGLEYVPTSMFEAGLDWLPRERRASTTPSAGSSPVEHHLHPYDRTRAGPRPGTACQPRAPGRTMTTIAFIGLGIMGEPMAGHLVDAGHDVVGVDHGQPALDRLVSRGGRAVGSIAEAVAEAEVVITMVPDSPDVEAIALGDDGVYRNAKPGTLHVDCSSIRPDVARRLAAAGAERGMQVVDAPVSGGQAGAVEAKLSIMVGGQEADVARARPVLEAMGSTVVHVGPAGAGQTVKAANQLVVAGHLQLLAEAIVFLEAHGVDMAAAIAVLGGGLAGSTVLDRKAEGMLARSFEPGFRIDLHHKDLGIVTSSAREAGVVIPLGAHVAQLVGSLRAQGHGQLDHSALLLLVEQLSGRSTRSPDPSPDTPQER